MDTEIWQRLPEDLLFMILAKLPMRVLGKMRSVCKQWRYYLSSRDTLQSIAPNWSLHSTPAFLIQIHWDPKDDVESWVIEGRGSEIYKLPLPNHVVVNTCKGIFCCHRKGDILDLSIGVPGTSNWIQLPRPPIPSFFFNGLAFDSSTRRCILLLGFYYIDRRVQQGGDNKRIVMSIYDSDSNSWTLLSMTTSYHIRPFGKAIYSKGKFYWGSLASDFCNLITAFNLVDRVWTQIPHPEGCRRIRGECRRIFSENLGEYCGQLVLVEHTEIDRVRMWKLNEAGHYEIWCEICTSPLTRDIIPSLPSVSLNSSELIAIVDSELNLSIFNFKGKLIVPKMKLPGLRTAQRPIRGSGSAFETTNLWWP